MLMMTNANSVQRQTDRQTRLTPLNHTPVYNLIMLMMVMVMIIKEKTKRAAKKE